MISFVSRCCVKFQRTTYTQKILVKETIVFARPPPITVKVGFYTEYPRNQLTILVNNTSICLII